MDPGGPMTHYLVRQLQFTRREFLRGLRDVNAEEAIRRFIPMNSISWIVGHLADQENRYWVRYVQDQQLVPGLNDLVGYGRPASTPPLDDMWNAWRMITQAADCYLETLTPEQLQAHPEWNGRRIQENTGTLLLRNIHHYWFHLGEALAIRQMLRHTNLPEFIGDMTEAGYAPERPAIED